MVIYAVTLLCRVWRRVIQPGLARYAALRAVVAAGLVGHTCTELNYTSFGCDRPHWVLAPPHGIRGDRVLWFQSLSDHTFTSTHTLWRPAQTTDLYLRAVPSFPNPPKKIK